MNAESTSDLTWFLTAGDRLLRIIVALTLTFGALPLIPAANVIAAGAIYVQPDGDDVNCDGTINSPYPGSGGPGLQCAVRTIQHGVRIVNSGGTVTVASGTYTESVVITQSLTLNGAYAGTDPGSSLSRGTDESVIIPPADDPTDGNLVTVRADNVTVDGFALNGDNPAISGTTTINGAEVNAARGVANGIDATTWDLINGLTVRNTILRNFNRYGVVLFAGSSASITGNALVDNRFDTMDRGVALLDNGYAEIRSNYVTNANYGVQTNNFSRAGSHVTIGDNYIESHRAGIFHNLHYSNASPFTIDGNTLATATGADTNVGLLLTSLQNSVAVTITNNDVTGAYHGIYLWNVPTDQTVEVSGGNLTNNTYGVSFFNRSAAAQQLTVNSPASISGPYETGTAAFGPEIATPITADVHYPTTNVTGCTAFAANTFAGQIALLDRGTCAFTDKVKNAQDAGAVGVIIANNTANAGAMAMGGSDPSITIPAVSLSYEDGQTLKGQLPAPGINATLHPNTYPYNPGFGVSHPHENAGASRAILNGVTIANSAEANVYLWDVPNPYPADPTEPVTLTISGGSTTGSPVGIWAHNPKSYLVVDGTTISGNDAGLRAEDAADLQLYNASVTNNTTAGVQISGTHTTAVTLSGAPGQANTFTSNGGTDLSATLPYTAPHVNAYWNDWNATMIAGVESEIYHQVDDASLVKVDFYTLTLQASPTTAPANGTAAIELTNVVTGFVSPGSGIPISLTTDLGTLSSETPATGSGGEATALLTSTTAGTAHVVATAGVTAGHVETDTVDLTFVAAADLHLSKDDGQLSVAPGTSLAYTIVVTNVGGVLASGVVLTDTLPTGTTFVSASGSGTHSGGVVTWPAFDLGAGLAASRVVTVTVDNPAAASTTAITNTAEVRESVGDYAQATDVDALVASANLVAKKDDGLSSVAPGDVVQYTTTITNSGNRDAAGVRITDTLPSYVTFVSASDGGTHSGGTVTWPAFDLAGGGASTQRTITVQVNTVPSGVESMTNTVETRESGGSQASDADVNAVNAAPDLVLSKSDGVSTVQPGNSPIYTIIITNTGTQAATGVVVTDTLPEHTSYVNSSPTGSYANGVITWTLSSLSAGNSRTYVLVVNVDSAIPAGVNAITNTAGVWDDGTNGVDPTPGNNSDVDVDTLVAAPTLTLSKSDGTDTAVPGQILTYTLTVGNAGNQDAVDVALTDTLPSNVTFVSASGGGLEAGGVITWPLANLSVGDTLERLVTVQVDTPFPAGITAITNTAAVSEPEGSVANAQDVDTINAAPVLTVTKSDGLTTVCPNDLITYTIVVENVGNQHATGVVLTDTLPNNVIFVSATPGYTLAGSTLTWPALNLDAGDRFTRTVSVRVDDPLPAGVDTITNTATVAEDLGSEVSAQDVDTVVAVPDLEASKDDGVTIALPGQTLTYTLAITNTGDQGATGVLVTDTLPSNVTFVSATPGYTLVPGGLQWSVASLPAGSGASFTLTVQVDDPLPAGVAAITNTITVSDDGANGADPTPGDNTATDIDDLDAAPDLTLSKSDGVTTAVPGQLLTYAITVTNVGDQEATGVVLTDTIPANTTFISATSGYASLTGGVRWSLSSMPGSTSQSYTITVQVDDPLPAGVDAITNTATVSEDRGDVASDTDIDQIDAAPDLSLSKSDGVATATPGQFLTYVLNVQNTGDQAASGVVITDTLPAHVTFVSASGGGTHSGGVVTWTVATISGYSSIDRTLTVQVDSPIPAGVDTITNTARVFDDGANGADPTPADNADTDVDTVDAAPDLQVTKSDGVTTAVPGQVLTYAITVTNAGDQGATGVTITDTLPAHTALVSTSGSPIIGTGTVTWTLPTLPSDKNVVFTLTVQVDALLPAGVDVITNTAAASDDGANGADPTPGDNVATDVDTIVAHPDLQVAKDDGLTTAVPGQTLTYTIVLTNAGDQEATGVTLTDVLPEHTALVSTSGSPAVGSGAVTWTLPSLLAGSSATFILTVQVDAPLPAGVAAITNTITVSDDGANGADPTPGDNTATDIDDLDAAPDLTLSKSDGVTTAVPGQILTYTITVTNAGDQEATGVVLTDTIPAHTTFVAASGGGTHTGGTVTWPAFALPGGGASATFTLTVRVDDPLPAGVTAITNTVQVTEDRGASASDTDVDLIDAAPALSLSKSDGIVTAVPGQFLTYTIVVENTGNQAATGVIITDTLPANTTFDSASDGGTHSGGVVTWSIAPLCGYCQVVRTLIVQVDTPLPAGVTTITNMAQVSEDRGASAGAQDVDLVDAAPDLQVAKDDGVTTAVPGQTLTYAITVTNAGDQAATGVTITDTIPAHTAFVAASGSGAESGGTVTWPAFALPGGGASATFTLTVQVANTLPAGVDAITNTATASDDGANGADPTPGDNGATDVDTIDAAPNLQVAKDDGLTTAVPGQLLTYAITVTNAGDQEATGVTLTDVLPEHTALVSTSGSPAVGSSAVTWTRPSLLAGSSAAFTLTVQVDAPLPAGVTAITNTATASDDGANGADPTPGDNVATDVDAVVAHPDLQVAKDDGVTTAVPGQLLTYTIVLTNTGNQAATGVVLTDTLPAHTTFVSASDGGTHSGGSVTWPAFALPGGGASATFTLTVQVDDPLPAGVTAITNTASARDDGANGADPTPGNNTATDVDTIVAAPALDVSKDDGVTTAVPGQLLTYTIVLTNTGNQAATGVVLTDTLPAHTTFVSASDGGTHSGGSVTWSVAPLCGYCQVVRTLTVRVDDPLPAGVTAITNTVQAAEDRGASAAATDVDLVDAAPDLQVAKSDGVTTAVPGQVLTYAITVTNAGDQEATGVVLTDTLPEHTALDAATPGYVLTGSTLTWPAFALPGGGASATFTLTVQVDAPLPAGVDAITNTAAASDDGANGADPTPGDNVATDVDTIVAYPDLQVAKSDGVTTAVPGQTLTYAITVTNAGDQEATGVVLTDVLPEHTALVSASGSPAVGSSAVTWTLGSLLAGSSATFTLTVQVDAPLPAGVTTITNTATVSDDGTNGADPTPGDNVATDVDAVVAHPDLQVAKDDGVTTAVPGQILTYAITVTNAGDQAATGVALTDTIPAHTTFDVASGGGTESGGTVTWPAFALPGGGASAAFTLTVRVDDPLPAGVTAITNTVTVNDDGANGADPTPGNNTATDVDLIDAAPALQVAKDDGVTTAVPGQILTYTIVLTNTGNQAATGVVITDVIPAHTTFDSASGGGTHTGGTVTWSVAPLCGYCQVVRTLVVRVETPLPAGVTALTNTVQAAEDRGASAAATDVDAVIAHPNLQVAKSDGVTTAVPGQVLTYAITVTNAGDQEATGVVLTDTIPTHTTLDAATPGYVLTGSTLTWPAVALPGGGASATFTLTVQVDAPLPAGVDVITNTAAASDDGANGADPTPGDNVATDVDTIVAHPDLQVAKSDSVTTAVPGQLLTYAITVTNAGDQEATGVVLTDVLPEHTALVSTSGSPAVGSSAVTWTRPSLLAGSSATFTLTVQVDAPLPAGVTAITNTATASDDGANGADPTPGDNVATDVDAVVAHPDLQVAKSDGVITAVPGQLLTYAITVTNAGDQAATGVALTDTIPAHTTFVAASGGGTHSGGTVTWPAFALPGGGASATFTLTVQVDDPLPAGVTAITNTVTVNDDGANGADPTPGNNTATDVDLIDAAPALDVSKDDGVTTAVPDQLLTYTIVLTNTGDQAATGIVITDVIPAHTTFDSASDGGTHSGGTITWSVAPLCGYCQVVRTLVVRVDDPLPAGVTAITNTVQATEDRGASAAATDVDLIDAAPDLTLTKSDGTDAVEPDQALVYTLVVSNEGNQEAVNVILTDTLPNYVTFIAASNNGSAIGNVVSWPAISIPGYTAITRTLTVQADASFPAGVKFITNTARVRESRGDVATAQDVDSVKAPPNLAVTKDNGVDVIAAGDVTTYVITVKNVGKQGATGVSVIDTLPQGVTFISASDGGVGTDGIITWPTLSLAVGESYNYELVVQVNEPVVAGLNNIVNQVQVNDNGLNGQDPVPSNNIDTDVDTLNAQPDLVIDITDPGQVAFPGDHITYTITVANVGTQDATGVLVTSTLPMHTSFVAASSGGSPVGDVVMWPLFNLASGDQIVLNLILRVEPGIGEGETIDQLVVVSDDGINGPEPTPSNNRATASTPTRLFKSYLPFIQKGKLKGPDLVVDSITLTNGNIEVVIKNTGNVSVTDEIGFWVDIYIDPYTVPTKVNQTWDLVSYYGGKWGILDTELPLTPEETITLRTNDSSWMGTSNLPEEIKAGTPIYVQVDSANELTDYGAVLESHETAGGNYNNVSKIITSSTHPLFKGSDKRPHKFNYEKLNLPRRP